MVSVALSALCDSSVRQDSGLALLERTRKAIEHSSKNVITTEKKQNVDCSNMNEVFVKLLHPNRTHSSQDNKIRGKFSLAGPSGALRAKAQRFGYRGPEKLHK